MALVVGSVFCVLPWVTTFAIQSYLDTATGSQTDVADACQQVHREMGDQGPIMSAAEWLDQWEAVSPASSMREV
eukprot:664196-Amphidinium_carterae.1